MTIRTWDAVAVGTVPGATLFNLNEQRGEEGQLCLYSDYKDVRKQNEHLEARLAELQEAYDRLFNLRNNHV